MQTKLTYNIVSDSGVGFSHSRTIDAPAYDIVGKNSYSIAPGASRDIVPAGTFNDGRQATLFHNKSSEEMEIKIHTDNGVFHIFIPANSYFDLSNVKIAMSPDGVAAGSNLQLGKVEALHQGTETVEVEVVIIQE